MWRLVSCGIVWILLSYVPLALGFDCAVRLDATHLRELSTEDELGKYVAVSVRSQYGLITTGSIARRVQSVTDRLLLVISRRAGLTYSVEVLATNQRGACAYPGGYVFLTKGLIDRTANDDELAVIIAHELAHVAAGQTDRPIEDELAPRLEKRLLEIGAVGRGFIAKLQERLCENITRDEVRKLKELRADEAGIVYVALAGYDISAAKRILNKVAEGITDSCQPSLQERQLRIAAQVRTIVERLEQFHAGVRLYVQGEYAYAAEAFRTFLNIYPGREVHHNLAAAYHRLALSHLPQLQSKVKCSLSLEVETSAQRLSVVKGPILTLPSDSQTAWQEAFQRDLSRAIEHYTQALKKDPAYVPAAANLGCAYLDQGKGTRAQAELEEVIQASPEYAVAYNNLGAVLLWHSQYVQARALFEEAVRRSPGYADPYLNLALLWHAQGDLGKMRAAWQHYVVAQGALHNVYIKHIREQLDLPESDTISPSRDVGLVKTPLGIRPGQNLKGPAKSTRQFLLFSFCSPQEDVSCRPVRALFYEPSAMTVLTIESRVAHVAFTGLAKQTTTAGIGIGHTERQVREYYGPPTRIEEGLSNRYLAYDLHGLAFAIRDGQVVSWFIFDTNGIASE